ncbi:MAG: Gmad2 immunoglobulin-like domain-containing protein [Candidatus Paceibacterota bacterium]
MENKKSKIITIIIIVICICLPIALYLIGNRDNIIFNDGVIEKLEILGNKDDLISFSIKPGQEVSGINNINGVLKGGYFFEANVIVRILDVNKNILKNTYGTATEDWMTADPIAFKTSLNFSGLQPGPAYIKIEQDDPSGGESGMKIKEILIPVIIK